MKFVIVGAGMGGLAAALRLSHGGHRVTVLEKTGMIGGRNRPVKVNECRFDGGPTLLMMLDPFRKLFADVGERFEDHLQLELLDPSYTAWYRDGSRIQGTPDKARMAEQIELLCGSEDAEGYRQLLRDLEAMYQEAMPRFVQRNYYKAAHFLNPDSLRSAARHGMLGNLARRIERYVQDPRLRMLFSFQTMYLGLSPFESPWVYAVLTYMEYGEGIWYPQGGLVEIAHVIAKLAEARGAEIRLDTEAAFIEGKTVELVDGQTLDADAVIVNADLPYAERELLGLKPARRRKFSCSAYAMYVDYCGELPALGHHSVFFGEDFRGNLEQIFNRRELPSDPAFYAAVSCRSDPGAAPEGHENLFLLVPCANLDRNWTQDDADTLRARAFQRLAAEAGFDEDKIAGFKDYGPQDYAGELNLERGAAFGLSHHFSQSAFFRPSNRSRQNPYVYFVGASTVPGNGLPMVLISAELLEERLNRELGAAQLR
ncbi:MAG TPA: phytoene desaturase family protein [Fimbriimonas sp.]|nr:phytoene desaturase family protein [Fimbriimonas sp.]